MNKNIYIKQLEETISKFLKPLKDIPFPIAVKAISGHDVLSFDKTSRADKELLERLTKAMDIAVKNAYQIGISTARANEVGNHIEPFVKDALNSVLMKASIPLTSNGKHQSAGYPDIFIKDIDDRVTYLECKTYNKKSINSSFRAFYFQPSKSSKITHDARHLMVGFEINKEKRNGQSVFVPIHWKLYTLEKMLLQVKHEFNTSNQIMYKSESLLAEGSIGSKNL
jgi:hypothetical protein